MRKSKFNGEGGIIAPKGLLCRDVQKIMCVRPFVRPSVRMFWGPFLDLKIPVSPLMVPFGRSKKGPERDFSLISRDLDRPGK